MINRTLWKRENVNINIYSLLVLLVAAPAFADHPEVLVSPADHDAMVAKLRDEDWARAKYDKLKAQVDEFVRESGDDPTWLSSRLAMNWQTHFTTPVCERSRFIRGEGKAPVPTPRFAGARDWATSFTAPKNLADFPVHSDDDRGRIFLHDSATNRDEWTAPGVTGRTIETINQRIMQAAADASFVYWITGDEKYARFASDALWTYMQGFAYVKPPLLPEGDRSMNGIIGTTSFEVIHEDIVTPLALSYDFLHDYLAGQGKDLTVIQFGLKRMIDRVIDGGSREGNWNLNQARIIAYGGLALENDDAYPDHKGRRYYVDVVLNADLPHQLGITRVIHHGIDQKTALWPEAPGYGFGACKDITLIASLVGKDPAGKAVLGDPILSRSVLAQANMTYPNGLAVGLGDTTDTRVNSEQLELLIAAARDRHDAETEDRLTAILREEISSGNYDRATAPDELVALTKFVGKLKAVPVSGALPLARAYFGEPLNVLIQRILGDSPETSLAAAIYGTGGGHVHANGLAIELYGAGVTMGADPGRGDSYWTKNHAEYYSQPPAHNTVIVNGLSDYGVSPAQQIHMTVQLCEPPWSDTNGLAPALCPNIGFAQCGFEYTRPVAAVQQRTLALVRPFGSETGFYFDVFRSRAEQSGAANQFHDYLYHNVGHLLALTDLHDQPLGVAPSNELDPKHALLKGYSYFTNERAIKTSSGWHARFGLTYGGLERTMDLWMPGQSNRTLFSVDGPPDHEARGDYGLNLMQMAMPTLIVRQNNDAWDLPFIAVYEPSTGKSPSTIESIESPQLSAQDAGLAACVVRGKSSAYTAMLMQDIHPDVLHANISGASFQGSFGVVITKKDHVSQLYLGSGVTLGSGDESIGAIPEDPGRPAGPIAAALWRDGAAWRYSASAPVRVTIAFDMPSGATKLDGLNVFCGEGDAAKRCRADLRLSADANHAKVVLATMTLPANTDQLLTVRSK